MGSNLRAEELLELANNYLKTDNYELAAENYFQAAKLFIEAGKYYKSRDAFIAMSVLLKQGMKYYPSLLEQANSLVMMLNSADVNVPEISGEILMFCGTTAYDFNDIKQSALCFEKAYENYAMSDLEEYRGISVGCLLKAAYSYYVIGESDKAEQLMLKAVELNHQMDKSVLEIESELSDLVRKNKLDAATVGYKTLAEILLSEIDSLRELMEDFKDFDAVAVNVKARLIHMAAENYLKATLCSEERIEELLQTTSQLFELAVNLMYGLINVDRVDPEDIQRFGFDFLLAVILKDKVNGNKEAEEYYNEVLFELIDEDLRPTISENKYVKTAKFVVDNQSHLLLRALNNLPIGRVEQLREIFTDMIKNL